MADVPQRIWASKAWASTFTTQDERENAHPFILASPEALAAAPEVQALIRAAKAEGMREAAGMLPGLLHLATDNWSYLSDVTVPRILAAAEKLERG